MDLEARLDELYAAPPDEFTRLRNELAAELTKSGDKEDAAAVKKLKKPVVAAWLLNQLALSHADQVRELLELGEAGPDETGQDLRGAMAKRRALVADLARRAKEIADERGVGAGPVLSELPQTLLFVPNSPDRENFERGRLTKPPEASVESAFGAFTPDADDAGGGEDDRTRRARRRSEDLEQKARAAEAEWSRANAAAEAAAREAEAAARRAEDAQKEVAAARRRADQARARAEQAAREVGELGG